jgi:1,2-diacylglycerol 3-alpha-glucosyltransferase
VRIGIATDFHSPWIGGPATFIDNFSSFLAGQGHTVDIFAPSPTGKPWIERRGNVTIRRLPTIPLPFGYDVRATARIDLTSSAVVSARPDVIQVHHPFPLGFAAMRAARRLHVPVVAINHTIPECSLFGIRNNPIYPLANSVFSRYLTWFLAQADAICTPTSTAATLLQEMGTRQHVEVISNGIDIGRFTPSDNKALARRELGLPEKPTILYTGRLDAEKDMETWLRACAMVVRTSDAHLVVGGEGTHKPKLQQLAHDLHIEDRVTFPGYLPIERLPQLYQAADVYCITSAVELQSITTLEAIATGLPVVAANARALPELVEDNRNGFLASPGDAGAFARGLEKLLSAPERAREMGALGRKRAQEHSLSAVARRHEALLERVAERRVGSSKVTT